MAVLLVVVFFVILFFTLLPEFIPRLSKKMVRLVVQDSDREGQLREELKVLKEDLKQINMGDEFAKYAKTERKIIRITEEVKKFTKSKTEVFLKMKLGTNIIYHVLQVMCLLSLIWTFRYEPLMSLPESWTWPFSSLVAFPSGIPGAVGITFWMLVCRTVCAKARQIATAT